MVHARETIRALLRFAWLGSGGRFICGYRPSGLFITPTASRMAIP